MSLATVAPSGYIKTVSFTVSASIVWAPYCREHRLYRLPDEKNGQLMQRHFDCLFEGYVRGQQTSVYCANAFAHECIAIVGLGTGQ